MSSHLDQTGRRTDLDLEREGDLDPERLEARDGLTEPERLSDLTWAGLPRSDLDGERESWCHTRMLKQLYSGRALTDTHAHKQTNTASLTHTLLQCIANAVEKNVRII